MAERINWQMGLSVVNGPSISLSDHFDTEAYDHVTVKALKTGDPLVVEVQPGDEDDVHAILIMSDNYTDLAFTVDQGDPVTLDEPFLLVGAGAVGLLGATCKEFTFTNSDTEKDANITILVARTAVEPGA